MKDQLERGGHYLRNANFPRRRDPHLVGPTRGRGFTEILYGAKPCHPPAIEADEVRDERDDGRNGIRASHVQHVHEESTRTGMLLSRTLFSN
ncbi:hypothetical protein F5X98DRAFT_371313 [Xylaria grammica]|nr:hypothetical protein F5X98DRAFT_371313 [Xylaria grammica]